MDYLLLTGSNDRKAEERTEQARVRLYNAYFSVSAGPAIWTPAREGDDKPSYLNQGLEIRTQLTATELKAELRALEAALGRVRGAATVAIDIDIIAERADSDHPWKILDAKSWGYDYAKLALAPWCIAPNF